MFAYICTRQMNPGSTVLQSLEQPSPLLALPSSHTLLVVSTPLAIEKKTLSIKFFSSVTSASVRRTEANRRAFSRATPILAAMVESKRTWL